MLTPDDGGRDGGFRSYLERPERWRHFDPELYGGLGSALRSAVAPGVHLIERSGLLPRTQFYSAAVPDARDDRDVWREALLKSASSVDLVFLDPDNGIEVPSLPAGRRGSSKYVTWQEIQGIWATGGSLLIYQHFPREPRLAFADRMLSELRRRTNASFLLVLQTAHVLFLLVVQERHEAVLRAGVSCLRARWGGEIEVVDPATGRPGVAAGGAPPRG